MSIANTYDIRSNVEACQSASKMGANRKICLRRGAQRYYCSSKQIWRNRFKNVVHMLSNLVRSRRGDDAGITSTRNGDQLSDKVSISRCSLNLEEIVVFS